MGDATEDGGQPIELQAMYFNGFQIALTNADISGVLMLNGQPQMVLNMSFTTAKSLHKALEQVIGELEQVTGRPIMVTKDVDEGLKTLIAKKNGIN